MEQKHCPGGKKARDNDLKGAPSHGGEVGAPEEIGGGDKGEVRGRQSRKERKKNGMVLCVVACGGRRWRKKYRQVWDRIPLN